MSRQDANAAFALSSFLYGGNAAYIEDLYARYEADPKSVDAEWQAFFGSLKDGADAAKSARGASWKKPPLIERNDTALRARRPMGRGREEDRRQGARQGAGRRRRALPADVQQATRDSIHALMLIRAYRIRGHFHANLDPLGLEPRKDDEELDPRSYGFTEADFDRKIFLDKVLGLEFGTLREIVAILQRTYCQTLGVEFMHISNADQKGWLQERIEGADKEITFTREGKRAILNKLVEAEGFEKFCDTKFTGTKRFGLDGGESLIPALEQIIKRGGNLGVKEIVLGMPHRGRLNVLTQVMGKPHRALFHEFKGGSAAPDDVEGSGDVKYHLGASSDREFDGNKVHLSLTANPSHLEIVNPVVLGKVRAKQDQHGATPEDRTMVLPLLMHGDAAFAGQGVVAECFGLSGLKGYRTGGSIHFIVNNQIGFTTYPRYSRSSPYPSDVAKMIEAPIFHVNGDDPGGRGLCRQGRDRIPAALPEAGRHRHVLLSPLRPQRGRRAGLHPAADVQGDPRACLDARNLLQEADRRRRRHRRRSREDEGRLARAARGRIRGRHRLQAEQGRLARRPLVQVQVRRRHRRSAPRQYRRRDRDAEGDRPEDHRGAGRLPRAPHDPALPRQPPQGDRDRRGHRLGDRRGARLLLAAARRPPRAPVRAGLASAARSRSAIRC